ncbi:hypothetical protein GEMRC1_010966 [Eukaryota sp. GEM-RC1]
MKFLTALKYTEHEYKLCPFAISIYGRLGKDTLCQPENFEFSIRYQIGVVVPQQLVFIDEVSFKSEHFVRNKGWSPKGQPLRVERPSFKSIGNVLILLMAEEISFIIVRILKSELHAQKNLKKFLVVVIRR